MVEYRWFASICPTAEAVKKIHEANVALDLDANSGYVSIQSNTLQEGERLFCAKKEFAEFCSKHTGRAVYIYYLNEKGEIDCVRTE